MRDDARAGDRKVLSPSEGLKRLSDRLLILPGQGASIAILTERGVVMIDAGPGGGVTARMIRELRAWTDAPVRAICYSHGHGGYNDGVADWLAHAAERGEPGPALIAQANLPRRYARYRETEGLQRRLNANQFPQFRLSRPSVALRDPTVTFETEHVLEGAPEIRLLAAPSETDDAMAVWIPEEGTLWAGAAFPGTTIPNIGTPLRTLRLTIRWAETLERLAALGARRLVPEFGRIVEGEEEVRQHLVGSAEGLRWLRREVVERMNRGMGEIDIVHDIDPPAALFDQPWMRERYGAISYIVRDLWREENGWWDRNPTSLHPARPDEAAAAALSAIADRSAVLARARALAAEGETQLALHVVDLLALAPGDAADLIEARALKAELCRKRAEELRPYVSKALYETSAARLEAGRRVWADDQ